MQIPPGETCTGMQGLLMELTDLNREMLSRSRRSLRMPLGRHVQIVHNTDVTRANLLKGLDHSDPSRASMCGGARSC